MSPIRLEIEHINGVTDRFVKYKIFVVDGVVDAWLADLDPLCRPLNRFKYHYTNQKNTYFNKFTVGTQ